MMILFLAMMSSALALTAQVSGLRGEATYQGKKLSLNQEISGSGEIVTAARSWVRLKILPAEDSLLIGAASKIKLAEDTSSPELSQGALRWVSGQITKTKSHAPTVRTPTAVFGVRGTDFLVSYGPLLTESQIVCFDGVVNFSTSAEDAKDITKGQWGGVGGRFGKRVGNIADLPVNVLEHFQKTVPLE